MNQVLSKYPWSLEVLGKIFLGLKGHFHIVLFLIYFLQKKPYQTVLSCIPDRFGDTVLEFKKVNPGEIANMSLKTATVIQAIKSLGKENINREVIRKIRETLTEEEISDLMDEAKSVPSWIYEVIREVSEDEDE